MARIGSSSFYWTSTLNSTSNNNNPAYGPKIEQSVSSINVNDASNINNGFTIRCIAGMRQNEDGSLVHYPF